MSEVIDQKYIPLKVDNIQVGVKSPVDLYARISENDFVKLFSAGEKPNSAKLQQHGGKRINFLWVIPEEFHKLTQHNVAIAKVAVESDNYSVAQSTKIVSRATTTLFTELSSSTFTPQNYALASEISKYTTTLAESHSDLYEIIENLSSCSADLVRYSLSVSALSLVIAKAMGWKNKITKEKLAIGGLLHRIGVLDLPADLLKVPIAEYSTEQKRLFHTYPEKGRQKLIKIGTVPEDVTSIVYEHQERMKGNGYPRGITESRIHPLAKVVGIAEAMTYYMIPNINNGWKGLAPNKAYKVLSEAHGEHLSYEIFNAVSKIIARNSLRKTF